MKTLLTIAGFDPSSGAGVTADLAVFAAHGFFGTACVTALTVQATTGVEGVHASDTEVVVQTLQCLQGDIPPAGIKIGMLANEENVRAVADYLEQVRLEESRTTVVLDPILRSSSGRTLLTKEGTDLLRERLLPLVDWVTPNLEELSMLTERQVRTAEDCMAGADLLRARHSGLGVVVTGGHLEVEPDDLVVPAGEDPTWIRGARIVSRSTHGTGCAFSSAMLCGLVRGLDSLEAARTAKYFVAEAIRRAEPIGKGNGPMELLWPLKRPRGYRPEVWRKPVV